jgi:hypothetical protein
LGFFENLDFCVEVYENVDALEEQGNQENEELLTNFIIIFFFVVLIPQLSSSFFVYFIFTLTAGATFKN